jgi:mersacidin/lichenicidin family type 2 lantibiotic
MSAIDVVRAWKDEDYRLSLSSAEQAMLPDSPVGNVTELTDSQMESLAGGSGSYKFSYKFKGKFSGGYFPFHPGPYPFYPYH